MAEQVQYDRVYATKELAKAVDLTVGRIVRMCQDGDLKASRTERGEWRILGSAWMNWLISHMPCRNVPERWMTAQQDSRYCDVSATTIARWVREGTIPAKDDGSPSVRVFGPRMRLVHGSALRKVVRFRGPRRKR